MARKAYDGILPKIENHETPDDQLWSSVGRPSHLWPNHHSK